MAPYVTFLLDLAAERDNRAIADTVRYAPDSVHVPRNAFVWKIVCDSNGTVSIRASAKGRPILIAAATLENGQIRARRQREPNVPTGPQWGFVAAALAAELAIAGTADDAVVVEPITDDESRYLRGAQDDIDTEFRYADQPPKSKKTATGLMPLGIAAAIVAVAMIVVPVVRRAASRVNEPAPSPPPAPPTPAAPPVPVSLEAQVAAAPSFAAAIALAKGDPSGALLARYPKLTLAEVDVPAETSVGLVQKDAESERGKRMCAKGTIEGIQRTDVERRRVFVGRLRQDDGDVIAFTALGTTGDLIRRSKAKFCGAVIGTDGDAVVLVGMFDLAENRMPLVEQ